MGEPLRNHCSLQIRRTLAASKERVFRAWTEPENLRRWFHPDPSYQTTLAETDLVVGGRYRIRMEKEGVASHVVGGEYLEIEPHDRVVFTWNWEHETQEEAFTLVTVQLRDHPEGTELELTHERFETEEARDKHEEGWGGCLAQLDSWVGTPTEG